MTDCPACTRAADATATLAARGERMTPLRARVLEALHHAEKPVGAYELFGQLKAEGAASAPPAVYRVLDFLEAQGIVHKLPSLAAYRVCSGGHAPHRAMFRICRACGRAEETGGAALDALAGAAGTEGFRLEALVVEAFGVCAACAPAP